MRYSLIVSALCCLVAVGSHAQESPVVTVRLINTMNGKPVPHRGVLIDSINPDTHMWIVEQGLPLKGTTNDEGKVSFSDVKLRSALQGDQTSNGGNIGAVHRKRLSKSMDLAIIYAGGGGLIQCSTGKFSLDEIVASGVVGDNRCDKKFDPTKFKVDSGEVIMFVRKAHWWENFED